MPNVKTGKILAVIGLALNLIYLIYMVYLFATIGFDGLQEMQQEWIEQYG